MKSQPQTPGTAPTAHPREEPFSMNRSFDLWLPSYLRRRLPPLPDELVDIMLCICDHFEPMQLAEKSGAQVRMTLWRREFLKFIEGYPDADGVLPRHTFFYPLEKYDRDLVSDLEEICRSTGTETEVHLHHDRDTAENLRQTLERGKDNLARHQLLSRDARGGVRFGFIHGDWALDNSHPAGESCGVSNELAVLQEAGCYADFTMPSAPDPTQTRTINSIYYATDTPAPKSHDTGEPVRVRKADAPAVPHDVPGRLLMIQGPLGLNWKRRKFSLLPRIENGDLTGNNPPTPDRMSLWLRLGIGVQGRPNWRFIKLHTHGAKPPNLAMLLGNPMRAFHQHLAEHYNNSQRFRLHYVTARELVNIVHAAEDGQTGNPGEYRNYRYQSLLRVQATAGARG